MIEHLEKRRLLSAILGDDLDIVYEYIHDRARGAER